jgi:hypothetical protein
MQIHRWFQTLNHFHANQQAKGAASEGCRRKK